MENKNKGKKKCIAVVFDRHRAILFLLVNKLTEQRTAKENIDLFIFIDKFEKKIRELAMWR